MKIRELLVMAAGAAAIGSAATAGDFADACVATLEAEGRDASGCACLEEEIVANGLEDEFLSLGEIADPADRYAAASDEAKAVMDKCTR